jgi:diaminopimelate epimerase
VRTNVQIVHVDRPGEVTARVWERGVGETTASGTSAVAVAAATHGDGEVVVHFPGGDLRVRLAGGRAWLTGPAEQLAEFPVSHRSIDTDS